MSDALMDKKSPKRSPDILAPVNHGDKGGRRLNNVPMMAAVGFGAVFLCVVGYTLAQRQAAVSGGTAQAEEKAAKKAGPTTMAKSLTPAVLQGAPQAGIVPTDYARDPAADGGAVPVNGNQMPAFLGGGAPRSDVPAAQGATLQNASYQPGDRPMVTPPPPPAAGAVQPAPVSPYADQWENYRRQQEELRRAKFEASRASLSADIGVQARQPTSATAPASQSPLAALTNALGGMASGTGPAGAGPGYAGGEDANGQAGKKAFLDQKSGGSNYLGAQVQSAISPRELKAGTVIPAKLISGVNSDLPGQIVGVVDRDVYDSATGRYLLVPQGAKLVGTYDSNVTMGQRRTLVGWKRIIYPDGSSIDLGTMPGVDRAGYGGFQDKVNNHYARTFGSAFMVSVFSAGIQLSQPQAANGQNISSSQTVAAAIGQQMGQLGTEVARRNLQIQPTLETRPGYRFQVMITKDMVLREWRRR